MAVTMYNLTSSSEPTKENLLVVIFCNKTNGFVADHVTGEVDVRSVGVDTTVNHWDHVAGLCLRDVRSTGVYSDEADDVTA